LLNTKGFASLAFTGLRGSLGGGMAGQARVHVGHGQTSLLAGGDGLDLDLRVLRQQAQQLDPGVAGATDDADLDHLRSFQLERRHCRNNANTLNDKPARGRGQGRVGLANRFAAACQVGAISAC